MSKYEALIAFLQEQGIDNVAMGTWDNCWELNILIPKEDD